MLRKVENIRVNRCPPNLRQRISYHADEPDRRLYAVEHAKPEWLNGYSVSSMASSRAERTMSMATSSTAVAEAVGVSTDR
jgi:hypothetical protein